jgi:hypothetical protein
MYPDDDAPPGAGATGRAWVDQPWWAAALLTVGDLLDRPELSLAVWAVVIGPAVAALPARLRHRRTGSRDPGNGGRGDVSRPSFLGPCDIAGRRQ